MAKVLVTGGAGYVGSICASQLLNNGHEVAIIDDLSTGHQHSVPAGADFYPINMGDTTEVKELLRKRNFDVVFHFAARALISESMTDPAEFYRVNVIESFNLLESLRAARVNNFVFSSTAATYGNPTTVPIPEDHPKAPVNSYGESKLAFEHILEWYARAYQWTVVAFRYFNACGATATQGELHQPETHIIPLLLQTASGRRDHFDVYGTDWPTPDGSCLRDYVHVLDIADAHLLALRNLNQPGYRAYNIGTGTSYSVLEICRVVEELTGRKLNIRQVARRPGDPAVLCASAERITRDFGWKPAHSDLHSIVRSAWEWEQKQVQVQEQTAVRR
jgi:UDP-glucose 4-epimerase